MATARVHFHRSLAEKFVRRARSIFPAEYFVYLLGRETHKGWTVHEVVWPNDTDIIQDPEGSFVEPQYKFLKRVKVQAKEKSLDLIGDLHSHCYHFDELSYSDPVPSFKDFERWKGKPDNHSMKIFGICELRKNKIGRIYKKFSFWEAKPSIKSNI